MVKGDRVRLETDTYRVAENFNLPLGSEGVVIELAGRIPYILFDHTSSRIYPIPSIDLRKINA